MYCYNCFKKDGGVCVECKKKHCSVCRLKCLTCDRVVCRQCAEEFDAALCSRCLDLHEEAYHVLHGVPLV